MNHQELSELFFKLVNNQCSEEEAELIIGYLADESNARQLQALVSRQLKQPLENNPDNQVSDPIQKSLDGRLQRILQLTAPPKTEVRSLIWNKRLRYAAAAILLPLAVGTYLLLARKTSPAPALVVHRIVQPIVAGGNKAILTLNDGRKIDLDDASTGEIATQSNTVIKKTASGVLVYDTDPKTGTPLEKTALPQFNTITTPKGGQYQVVLPDGSKVWLNAASSLKYPAQFDPKERLVELNGEGYFEIAASSRLPFVVLSNHQKIEVLGTMFNVNAYGEEACVRTTLLNGAVRVGAIPDNQGPPIPPGILKPGQQSELFGHDLRITEGNTEAALAWKNGMFQFENEDIQVVMRKIARWYDVEVEYHGNMKGKMFTGTISRYENVNEVLKYLQLTGTVSFTIKDRKIIVS
jgi:ferric-dicitrate binding protein FerR (iron transport regulator)